jgi:hypothetical protein
VSIRTRSHRANRQRRIVVERASVRLRGGSAVVTGARASEVLAADADRLSLIEPGRSDGVSRPLSFVIRWIRSYGCFSSASHDAI